MNEVNYAPPVDQGLSPKASLPRLVGQYILIPTDSLDKNGTVQFPTSFPAPR
jgi:hypothetical protein